MKTLRRTLKLLPPAFLVRIWLDRRHGIKVPPAPGGAALRFALAILPYAFTAALSVRVESDCRLMKYFLPYGRMKKFVRLMYAMQVGNDGKDHGVAGKFRAIMPYGLVLWWDAEDRRIAQKASARKPQAKKAQANKTQSSSGFAVNFGWRMPERERMEFQRMDRVEAMALRLCIMTAAGGGLHTKQKEET